MEKQMEKVDERSRRKKKMIDRDRRDFIKSSTIATVALVSHSDLVAQTDMKSTKIESNSRSRTEDMLRREFELIHGKGRNGSKIGYASLGNTAYEIERVDGVITRESQSARYLPLNSYTPDINPSGDNRTAQYSQMIYQGDRVLYPMRRIGMRGEGKWERLSWDDAIDELARKIYEVISDPKRGPARLMIDAGTDSELQSQHSATLRLSAMLGAVRTNRDSTNGELFSGATIAYGEPNVGHSYEFLYGADTIIFWGIDPSVSNTADAHFISEAKYRGADIIVISTQYNATAKSADLWVPTKRGSDNILAASIIHEIINKKLYKSDFVKIFTDLPLLVIKESKKLLRRSDIEDVSDDKDSKSRAIDEFYSFDKVSGNIALMPGSQGSKNRSLDISELGIDPMLEGEWKIRLLDGNEVMITTVFEMLKQNVESYSPQEMQAMTGVNPTVVSRLAKSIAVPKVVSLTVGSSLCREFNGIMTIWNISSICGLTGRIASYGGLNTSRKRDIDSDLITLNGRYSSRLASGFINDYMMGDDMSRFEKYFTEDDIAISQNGMDKSEYISIVRDILDSGKDGRSDTDISAKPWWITDTLLLVDNPIYGDGISREYREEFCKNMRYFAYVDYRMSHTALYSDLLLPLKSRYESSGLEETNNMRYANLSQPMEGLEAVGESKDEWTIMAMLAKRLEEIASSRENVDRSKIKDDKRYAKEGYHDLTKVYQEFTNSLESYKSKEKESRGSVEGDKVEISPNSSETMALASSKDEAKASLSSLARTFVKLDSDSSLLTYLLGQQKEYQPWSIKKMQDMGGFLLLDRDRDIEGRSPIYTDRAYSSFEDILYKLERFETLTGRQTFYVDDDIYIRLESHTNRGSGGIGDLYRENYPLSLITTESRWSSSAISKTAKSLLRLHRGVPYIKINTQVAEELQIEDGDRVRVYNELGEFEVMAKLSHSTPLASLFIDSGWEPYMFENNRGEGECIPHSLNLLEMVDGWGHLKFSSKWDGNRYINDGRVNIERVGGSV